MNKNTNNLDEALQQTENLRGLVHGLPEDQVSLQWRSALNEQILAMAAKPKKTLWSLFWKPASGLALAGALTAVVIMQRPAPVAPNLTANSEFASAIFEAHEASYAYREIGVTMPQSQSDPLMNLVDRSEEVDLGAL